VAPNAVRIAALDEPRSNVARLLPAAPNPLSRMLPDEGPKSSVPPKPERDPESVRLPVVVVATASRATADPLIEPLSVIPPAVMVPVVATMTTGVAMPDTDPNDALPPPSRSMPLPAAAMWLSATVPESTRR
jgi:hypothetical protein